jgi:hypothetical protein
MRNAVRHPTSIDTYLKCFAPELGARIQSMYPPLVNVNDPQPAELSALRRTPYPAQALAIAGLVRGWEERRSVGLIAECGSGKTLISLGAVFAHAQGQPFTSLAMVPPQLVEKWCRETFQTLPCVRVFVIDGVRNGVGSSGHTGVNEVRYRGGRIVREGLRTTLSEMRLRRHARSARVRWNELVHGMPSLFVCGRDRGKLSYSWEHAFKVARSGGFLGSLVNVDTGGPVIVGEERLTKQDFKRAKLGELIGQGSNTDSDERRKLRRTLYSALWQADRTGIHRYAPLEFIQRYLGTGFFDYGVADEVHELKGETAQGSALASLVGATEHSVILTGTLLGGYADDLFNILFRLDAPKMLAEGFVHGDVGVRAFSETYGVLEKITVIEPIDNACSKARTTKRVRRRPGASPLLFGRFLMGMGAFVSLEDISDALPPYEEEVVAIEMDQCLKDAYEGLEEQIKKALKEHRGNQSVVSVALNALLLYPDRPFRLGTLIGYDFDHESQRREPFVIAEPEDLDEAVVYAKERTLVQEVTQELAEGRRCQIYAVYTQKRDVTRRLQRILSDAGICTAVLTSDVKPEQREAWYEKQLSAGAQAFLCHPRLVQTGLDLVFAPSLLFYETGYSIFTLRQASRRSWRIGQNRAVKVKFLHYKGTMQESCLRLMGKKLLVALAMEGKFSSDGLQAMDDGGDILMTLARELVTEKNIGESADSIWKMVQKQQQELVRHDSEPKPPTSISECASSTQPSVLREGWMNGDSADVSSANASGEPLGVETSRQLTLF